MKCRDCPYGKNDFERRMSLLSDLKESDSEEFADDIEQFVWCDKVGGKVYCCGRCSDWHDDNKPVKIHNHSKRRRKNKRERDQLYKQHLKWLAEHVDYYPVPVTYEDEIWVKGYGYIENPKPYYKRWYRDNHRCGRFKYYKKYSNRVVRRYTDVIRNGQYRKYFDYWYTVC